MKPWQKLSVLLFALISAGLFIGFSYTAGFIGFPLDDAWIHQTYARNLIKTGRWEFQPGAGSGGSTSPLWSMLLVPGHMSSVFPEIIWSWLLGLFLLVLLGFLFYAIMRAAGLDRRAGWLAALFAVTEWHFVWAALSGMETILAVFICALFIYLLMRPNRSYWLSGILTGAAVWVRPELISWAGPVLFCIGLAPSDWRQKIRDAARYLIPFAAIFAGYLFFNLQTSGQIWPTTFFAKQAEYAALLQTPLFSRVLKLAVLPLSGAGVLLLPGFTAALFAAWKDKSPALIAAALWLAGFILLYALRLPVVYQHGRYMMPAMAVYFILGIFGTAKILIPWLHKPRIYSILARAWSVSLILVQLGFLILGAAAYRQDVEIIETEMVAAAVWIRDHTEPQDLIAVHDIGAVGYYSQRRILDLAGLINPEVIPFIRADDQLRDYLYAKGAKYLVVLPTWYDSLTRGLDPVYSTNAALSRRLGEENLTVYKLP